MGGRRLKIQKSKTSTGAVQVELIGSDRQSLNIFTVALADVGVVMMALEAVAQELELSAHVSEKIDLDGLGGVFERLAQSKLAGVSHAT
jgi:hypothetical protein